MARIPSPTALQDAKGYFLKHPERARKNEVKPEGTLPTTAPAGFNAEEKKVWRQFVKNLPHGLATAWDGFMAKTLVRLMAKEEYGSLVAGVRVPITVQERAQMISLSAKFGMTPADRAKLAIEAPAESKLQKFLGKKKEPTVQ